MLIVDVGVGRTTSRRRALLAVMGLGAQTEESGEFDKQTGGVKAFWAEAWKSKRHQGSGLSKQFDTLQPEVKVYGLGSR